MRRVVVTKALPEPTPVAWLDTESLPVRTPVGYQNHLDAAITPDVDRLGISILPDARMIDDFFDDYDLTVGSVVASMGASGLANWATSEATEARKAVPFSVNLTNFAPEERVIVPADGANTDKYAWRTIMPDWLPGVATDLFDALADISVAAGPDLVAKCSKYESDTYAGAPFYRSGPDYHCAADAIAHLSVNHAAMVEISDAYSYACGDPELHLPAAGLHRIQEYNQSKNQAAFEARGASYYHVANVTGAARSRNIKAVGHVESDPVRIIALSLLISLKSAVPGVSLPDLGGGRAEAVARLVPPALSVAGDVTRFDNNNSKPVMQLFWTELGPRYGKRIGLSDFHVDLASQCAAASIDSPTLVASARAAGQSCLRSDIGLKSGAIYTSAHSNLLVACALIHAYKLRTGVRITSLNLRDHADKLGAVWYGDNIAVTEETHGYVGPLLLAMGFSIEWASGEEILRSVRGSLYFARVLHRSFFFDRPKRKGAVELGTGVRLRGLDRHPYRQEAISFINRQRQRYNLITFPDAEGYIAAGERMLGEALLEEYADYIYGGLASASVIERVEARRTRVQWRDPLSAIAFTIRSVRGDVQKFMVRARVPLTAGIKLHQRRSSPANNGLY